MLVFILFIVMRFLSHLQEVLLKQYSKLFNVNVSPCGFVMQPDAPHLGASPDAKVYGPNAAPTFGLTEVK